MEACVIHQDQSLGGGGLSSHRVQCSHTKLRQSIGFEVHLCFNFQKWRLPARRIKNTSTWMSPHFKTNIMIDNSSERGSRFLSSNKKTARRKVLWIPRFTLNVSSLGRPLISLQTYNIELRQAPCSIRLAWRSSFLVFICVREIQNTTLDLLYTDKDQSKGPLVTDNLSDTELQQAANTHRARTVGWGPRVARHWLGWPLEISGPGRPLRVQLGHLYRGQRSRLYNDVWSTGCSRKKRSFVFKGLYIANFLRNFLRDAFT